MVDFTKIKPTQTECQELMEAAHTGQCYVNSIHKHGSGWVLLCKMQLEGSRQQEHRVVSVHRTSEGVLYRKTDFIV